MQRLGRDASSASVVAVCGCLLSFVGLVVPGGRAAGWVTGPGLAALAGVAALGCARRIRRDGRDTALAWSALLAVVGVAAAAGLLAWLRHGRADLALAHVVALGLLAVA